MRRWGLLFATCLALAAQSLAQAGMSTRVTTSIANASSTGTTLNKLAKLTGAPSTAVVTSAGDTSGAIGVVVTGAGTSGSAAIATAGQVSCVFDGATTAGHYVQISASVAGDCTDGGATYPTSGQVVGRVLSTNGSGGTYTIQLSPALVNGSGSVTINTTSPLGGGGTGSIFTLTCTTCLTSVTAHNLLSATHGDTTAASPTRGDGIFAIGSTPTWQRLAHPSVTGGYYKWNGTDIVASTGAAGGTGACAANKAVTTENADAAPTCTTIDSTFVGLGNVSNDAQTKASIVPNTAPATGDILVGNAGGTAYDLVAPGTAGFALVSNGPGAQPSYQAVGSGGGGYPAASVTNASGASSVAVTSLITSSYRDYQIRLSDITFSANGANLRMQFSTDNGLTWDSGTSYRSNGTYIDVEGAFSGNLGNSFTTFFNILVLGQRNTGTGDAGDGIFTLFNPLSTSTYKRMEGTVIQKQSSDNQEYVMRMGYKYDNTNAVNAIKFTPSSGTFSGRITVQPLP